MHRHAHDHTDGEQVGQASTRIEAPDPLLMRAAASGRTDVLGPAGMLHIQRAAGNGAAAGMVDEEPSPVLDAVSSGGQSLDEPVRQDMEARMGHDFGDVRVHTGDTADRSARSVSAQAYTVGSNIVFQRGAYDPASSAGQTLLAHELTHVVQQRSGPVDGTEAGGGIRVSDPSDRFERAAAANAEHVMSQPSPASVQTAPLGGSSAAVVQREAAPEEEEPVQAAHDPDLPLPTAIQRQEAEEEEPAP